jgi:hypothetical protein
MKLIASIIFILYTVLVLGCAWLTLSLGTSFIKTIGHQCGKTYGIEEWKIYGDFFCTTEQIIKEGDLVK